MRSEGFEIEMPFVMLHGKTAGSSEQLDMASGGKDEQWVAMTRTNFSLQDG